MNSCDVQVIGVIHEIVSPANPWWPPDLPTVAALAVALGTGGLAWFTSRLAKLTNRELEAQWRPVVVAQRDLIDLKIEGGWTLCNVDVPLVNAGRGPALNTTVKVKSENSSDEDTQTSDPLNLGTIRVEGTIRPDDPRDEDPRNVVARAQGMLYRDAVGGATARLTYTVTVTYDDLAGNTHETVLIFDDVAKGDRRPPLQAGEVAPTVSLGVTETRTPGVVRAAPRPPRWWQKKPGQKKKPPGQ